MTVHICARADRLRMSRTNSWGYLRNGTFDGMIGALVRREVDIGGSPIFFREERARVIDVTARTWIARYIYLMRSKYESRHRVRQFARPRMRGRGWVESTSHSFTLN